MPADETNRPPVVAVHGIMDSAERIGPLVRGLQKRGVADIHAFDLVPRWGNARLEVLAEQVAAFVSELRSGRGTDASVDLIGFSMGALVSRLYLQQLEGARHVRRFVSISGPHHGTRTAYLLPFSGVTQMRPGSRLLRSLGDDVSDLPTEVHCIYTPFDLMVTPPRTAVLQGACSVHRIPVPVHRLMLYDPRVLNVCAALLKQP